MNFPPAFPFPLKPWSGWYPPAAASDPNAVVNFEGLAEELDRQEHRLVRVAGIPIQGFLDEEKETEE